MSDPRDIFILKERLVRMEERLVAERSARRTREGQVYASISNVKADMDKTESSLNNITNSVSEMSQTLTQVNYSINQQAGMVKSLEDCTKRSRDSINHIQGSVRTIKFVIPLVLGLLGLAYTLLLANFELKLSALIPSNTVQQSVVLEEERK